jgi:hypothetical protein
MIYLCIVVSKLCTTKILVKMINYYYLSTKKVIMYLFDLEIKPKNIIKVIMENQ